MSETPKRPPAAFRLTPDPDEADRRAAAEANALRSPRRPMAVRDLSRVELEDVDPFAVEPGIDDALTPPPAPLKPRRFGIGTLFVTAAGLFVSMAIGLWADSVIRALFDRAGWLGWTGTGLLAVAGAAFLFMVARELYGLARLNSVAKLRADAVSARAVGRTGDARAFESAVVRHFSARPSTAPGRARLADLKGEIIDGPDLLDLVEKELLAALDIQARSIVLDSAKRVTVVTAVSPRALVDVGFVIMESMRLIRRIAELYGGRAGTLGFLRLARTVLGHLAVTGSIAVGDSLIQQVVGQGLAARLSARLGEGVINGLLTARIGIAAIDVCRPMPFHALPRPRIGDFMSDLTRLSTSSGST